MKKLFATISILLISVTMLIGCGKADPVQEDLINYMNKQMPTVSELANTISKEYDAVSAKNVDDATMAAKLKDVIIPAANELVTKTKAIVPATEELKKVHNEFITLVTDQQETFNLVLQALKAAEKNDVALLNTINEKLTNIEKKPNTYTADLEALKKAHKVENSK